MSGPVQPPLTVETIDGATVGRPITKIKVTNGTLAVSGSTATLTISGGGGGSGTVTSIATTAPLTGGTITTTGTIGIPVATGAADGYLSSANFNTFDAKQDAITLTTTGTSGAATFAGGTLNIPQYSGTTGTVTGTGAANQVSYWTAASVQAGSTGLTYDPSTGDLTVGGYVEVGTKITTPTGTDLTLDTVNGTDSGSIVIADGVDGQVSISANGSGAIKLGAANNPVTVSNVYTLPTAVTTDNGYVLTAQTDGSTAWAASGGGGSGTVTVGTYAGNNNLAYFSGATEISNTNNISINAAAGSGDFFGQLEASKHMAASDGSAGVPSFAFSNETNLGFFKDGSGSVSFTSGGTRQMTFSSNGLIRLGGSASNLSTYNNNLVLDTDLGANSGSIVIEAGTNGQISLTPDGTGKIKLDGVELDNTAIATGFVLKATSATAAGWAAESGGSSGGLIPPQIGTMSFLGSYNRYTTCSTPFAVQGIETNETSSQYDQNPIARPFILPEGGTWGGIEIKVTTASTSNSMLVALYNADSTTGTPTSLVGYCDIDTTSTGNITQTTTLDSSGSSATITLSANTQYWVSIVANANSDSCSLRVTLHESLTTLGSTSLSNLSSVLRNTFVSNAIETNNPPRFTQGLADRNFPVIGVIV